MVFITFIFVEIIRFFRQTILNIAIDFVNSNQSIDVWMGNSRIYV